MWIIISKESLLSWSIYIQILYIKVGVIDIKLISFDAIMIIIIISFYFIYSLIGELF